MTSESSNMGTIKFSFDMRLYFMTKVVKRRHKAVSFCEKGNWNNAEQTKQERVMTLHLVFVKECSMVEVGMRKNTVDATTNRPKLRHRRFFYAHPKIQKKNSKLKCGQHPCRKKRIRGRGGGHSPAGKVFVAVEETCSSIKSVSCVVNCWTLWKQLNTRSNRQ